MAADMVLWKNLVQTLHSLILPVSNADELGKFRTSLEGEDKEVERALATLASGTRMNDDEATRSRVKNLVALLHDADDLIDELVTLANHKKRSVHQRGDHSESSRRHVLHKFTQEVIQFFPSNHPNHSDLLAKVESPLKKINKSLVQLKVQLKDKFNNVNIADKKFSQLDSGIAKHRVIGRDADRDKIVNMLRQPQNDNKSNFSVISIVGSLGLGKSALAKFVYDDEQVRNHFDLRMWIQASQIDNEEEIIREIVESCTSSKSTYWGNYHHSRAKYRSQTNKNVLQFGNLLGCRSLGTSVLTTNCRTRKKEIDILERRIRRDIDGKLYLLVLDDVSFRQCPRLIGLLARGAKGSQILVTLRSSAEIDIWKSSTEHKLKGLSPKDSWTLFKESAFSKENEPEFETTGKSIVDMCEGVPLTIRVSGGLLYGKHIDMWLSFMKDIDLRGKHGNVMDLILQHSHKDLPTCLKACIGYCSLFPEHFEFNKHDLITLWIAQGLIDLSDRLQPENKLEDVGEMYFMELSRRYFFQEASTDYLGNIVTCRMHPLMYNLAHKNATGVKIVYLEDNGVCEAFDSECKHVSFSCKTSSSIKVPLSLLQVQGLRTFLSVKEPDCDAKFDKLACNTLISKLSSLRVLDLHDLGIKELPDCLGNLIHLRYLDISENDLLTLPKSVTRLYNLQTLKLNSCSKLTRLLGNYGELISLRRFELDECDSLCSMPMGLEKLTQLTTLSHFVVSEDCSIDMPDTGLKALEKLTSLRARLEIVLREDWVDDANEASKAHMHSKSSLTELKITWSRSITKDPQESSNQLSNNDKRVYQDFLENLRPHENLKILCIEGYKGSHFPTWCHVEKLPNLVVLSIEGCDKCEHLPHFGELKSLKRLTLRHMSNVQFVEGDGSSRDSTTPFFESLEELTLHNFYKLEKWRNEVAFPSRNRPPVHNFKKLSKLRIWNCPNLTTMPLFPEVLELDLRNVNQKLLEGFGKNVSLKSLQIKRCLNLISFGAVKKGLGDLPCIEKLVVDRCDALTSLASELKGLASLKTLEISSCKELDLSSDNGNNHKNNTRTSRRSSRRGRRNSSCVQIPKTPWASLKQLYHLTLKDIPKMKTLPEGLMHVRTLKFLWLSSCYALTELPEWIDSLTELQHLRIEGCSSLKRLPDAIKQVKSLMKVEITECPELMERCREHEGEDWHKIKHARILLHRSWRYGLMSEQGSMHNKSRLSNVKTLDNVKYFIIPATAAETIH